MGRQDSAPDDFSQRDIEFHRATAASYDDQITREHRIYHRSRLERFLDRRAAERPGGRVLDIGCGTGVATIASAARGFQVVGVDHSPDMLAIATRKVADAGLSSRVELETGDVTRLRFGDKEFDGVTCQGLLHHLTELEACLTETRRVLTPGGFLYISEPTGDATPVKRALLWLWRLVRRRAPVVESEAETVERPINAPELIDVLRRLGFECKAEYLTHLPRLYRHVPDAVRLALTEAISRPWRSRRGDIVFVYARRRTPS